MRALDVRDLDPELARRCAAVRVGDILDRHVLDRLRAEHPDSHLRHPEHPHRVVGFSYPVVPRGQARIRVQVSAAHEPAHLERAVSAFVKVGRALGVL